MTGGHLGVGEKKLGRLEFMPISVRCPVIGASICAVGGRWSTWQYKVSILITGLGCKRILTPQTSTKVGTHTIYQMVIFECSLGITAQIGPSVVLVTHIAIDRKVAHVNIVIVNTRVTRWQKE